MHSRPFGNGSVPVSEIGLGTWQLGGTEWGEVSDAQALNTLRAAADAGVTFLDTADIYGMGRSETLIGWFLKERPDRDRFFIATKLGRRPDPGWPRNFTRETIFQHTEDSLARLGVHAIDLTQTHCVPLVELAGAAACSSISASCSVKARLRRSARASSRWTTPCSVSNKKAWRRCKSSSTSSAKSQSTCSSKKPGRKASRLSFGCRWPAGCFRASSRPKPRSARRTIGISTATARRSTSAETFAGLPYEKALELIEVIRPLVPEGMTMAQFALRWCLGLRRK